MADPTRPHLDPDEVPCRTCAALPGQPCTVVGTTDQAKAIHKARRDLAAGRAPSKRPTDGKTPATPEGRSKAGKVTGERRRARRESIREQAAAAEQQALREQAERLAFDAARWDADRMRLRQLILDRALGFLGAADPGRLLTLDLDEDGNPQEYLGINHKGDPVTKRRMRGDLEAVDLRQLVWSAAVLVDKVRLEEGSPSSILSAAGSDGSGLSLVTGDRASALLERVSAVVDELEREPGTRPDREGEP